MEILSKFLKLGFIECINLSSFLLNLHARQQFKEIINKQFIKSSVATSALLYNCLNNNDTLQKQIFVDRSQNLIELWQCLLKHVEMELSEWSLWILFMGLKMPYYLEHLFSSIPNKEKLILVDICCELIDNELKTSSQTENIKQESFDLNHIKEFNDLKTEIFPKDSLQFLYKNFVAELQDILKKGIDTSVELDRNQVQLTCKSSSLILKISSIEIYRKEFQTDK